MQDAREGLLGRLFAYGAVIRAKGVIGNGSNSKEKKFIIEIIQQLCTLAKQKTFLREPVANLIIELARRVNTSALMNTLLDIVVLSRKIATQSMVYRQWYTADFSRSYLPLYVIKVV